MRVGLYFLTVLIVLLLGVIGLRGGLWSHEPLQIFDDMARQDRVNLLAEAPRILPPGSIPAGMGMESGKGVRPFSTRGGGYYETGVWNGYYGQGMPEELELIDKEKALAFIKRGREQFSTHCVVCHGESGDGKGIASTYQGFPMLVNLGDEMYERSKYPDGRVFFVISNGQGNMTGYASMIPIRDRWAIASWVRVLQQAGKTKPEKE